MSDRWYPPTWADAFEVPRVWRNGELMAPEGGLMQCPECRRPVPAEMVYRLPDLDAAVRAATKIRTGYACDACREKLFRHGHLSPADYLAAVGAPPDVVARAREKFPFGRR